MILIKSITWAQDFKTRVIHYGEIEALNDLITVDQIWTFTREELRILRNTIYAKHGYIFSSADLQEHFSRFSWYEGSNNNVEDRLTLIDRENIEFIQRIERNHPTDDNVLIGRWHAYGAVAADGFDSWHDLPHNDLLVFFPNGIYIYQSWQPHIGILLGLWSYNNFILEMIPLGDHIHHPYPPSYGRMENFIIRTFEFNDGSLYPSFSYFNYGGWVKEQIPEGGNSENF